MKERNNKPTFISTPFRTGVNQSSPFRVGANILTITALTLPIDIFAQAPNSTMNNDNILQTTMGNQQINPPEIVQQQATQSFFFGSENNKNKPCTDCDEVKQAVKASHVSSGTHYRISFNMKKWNNKFSGRMNMKIKRFFAHRKKIRTNYETCFNWH